ncbi:MAG: glutathione S-transferase [Gammaproteobacteria bacterium]|nr:glutathione S-transferase [Gammaproteobacteria bacterium]
MPLEITGLYAALSALVLTWLSFKAGIMRGRKKISVGDGGDIELVEAMRRHANAVEYIPIALILLGAMELNGANAAFLHALGAVLVLTRIAHPLGLKADNMASPLRAIGAGGTALVIVVAAVYTLWQVAQSLL